MGRLHCTQDPVPEAVRGDMQQLNQLGAQQFSALTEVLFHFLTEPKEVERFLAQLSEFATTNQMSLGPLKSIVKSLLLVPNGHRLVLLTKTAHQDGREHKELPLGTLWYVSHLHIIFVSPKQNQVTFVFIIEKSTRAVLIPLILTSERWMQKDQECKVMLIYIAGLRLA
nr:COMM domain-containing protein 7 isoform X2 [Peromyscus maniculatus bairdii]